MTSKRQRKLSRKLRYEERRQKGIVQKHPYAASAIAGASLGAAAAPVIDNLLSEDIRRESLRDLGTLTNPDARCFCCARSKDQIAEWQSQIFVAELYDILSEHNISFVRPTVMQGEDQLEGCPSFDLVLRGGPYAKFKIKSDDPSCNGKIVSMFGDPLMETALNNDALMHSLYKWRVDLEAAMFVGILSDCKSCNGTILDGIFHDSAALSKTVETIGYLNSTQKSLVASSIGAAIGATLLPAVILLAVAFKKLKLKFLRKKTERKKQREIERREAEIRKKIELEEKARRTREEKLRRREKRRNTPEENPIVFASVPGTAETKPLPDSIPKNENGSKPKDEERIEMQESLYEIVSGFIPNGDAGKLVKAMMDALDEETLQLLIDGKISLLEAIEENRKEIFSASEKEGFDGIHSAFSIIWHKSSMADDEEDETFLSDEDWNKVKSMEEAIEYLRGIRIRRMKTSELKSIITNAGFSPDGPIRKSHHTITYEGEMIRSGDGRHRYFPNPTKKPVDRPVVGAVIHACIFHLEQKIEELKR